MKRNHETEQQDDLRMRFTAWLSKVMHSTRADYLEQLSRTPGMVDIDSLPEEMLAWEDRYDLDPEEKNDFYFEERRISDAIQHLDKNRKRVLVMTYIEELSPKEISESTRSTIPAVYMQRSRALADLRKALGGRTDREQTIQPRGVSNDTGEGHRG